MEPHQPSATGTVYSAASADQGFQFYTTASKDNRHVAMCTAHRDFARLSLPTLFTKRIFKTIRIVPTDASANSWLDVSCGFMRGQIYHVNDVMYYMLGPVECALRPVAKIGPAQKWLPRPILAAKNGPPLRTVVLAGPNWQPKLIQGIIFGLYSMYCSLECIITSRTVGLTLSMSYCNVPGEGLRHFNTEEKSFPGP